MDTQEYTLRERVAMLNDSFRKQNPGMYMLTRGVVDNLDLGEVVEKVRSFDDFNEDNDPYGEHDFGSFTVSGVKIFWKIDYYDEALKGWCDPLSPDCHRVLTIMRADEY